jgi:hypothetical protein
MTALVTGADVTKIIVPETSFGYVQQESRSKEAERNDND